MKEEDEDENKHLEESDLIIFTRNGIEYIIMPQAWKFIYNPPNRDNLHQKVIRRSVDGVLKVDRYIFIPLSYCRSEKAKAETDTKNNEVIEITKDIPKDRLRELVAAEVARIEKEKAEQAKKGQKGSK